MLLLYEALRVLLVDSAAWAPPEKSGAQWCNGSGRCRRVRVPDAHFLSLSDRSDVR